ncbi:MAG: lysophospholipid acyltransferase family protein [Synechococcus sp.]|nr:lysophospholipid acyltransferase family protein [Synechococcus sp.]
MAAQSARLGSPRERGLCNGINPWLAPLAMVASQDLALKLFFRQILVLGGDHLPHAGPVLLAPTHRSRWDALLLPHAAGRRITGRDCRFMVTVDEMRGLQGWLLDRLGCFPVHQGRPSMASLRYPLDLLSAGHQLVVFPEGQIQRPNAPLQLHPGLARLAQLAAGQGVAVTVLPVGIAYDHGPPRWGDRAALAFAQPMVIRAGGRSAAIAFSDALAQAMQAAEIQALGALEQAT